MVRSALTSLARPLARQSTSLTSKRYASHGPTYNPPSGYLFGERVSRCIFIKSLFSSNVRNNFADYDTIAPQRWQESKGILGVSTKSLFRRTIAIIGLRMSGQWQKSDRVLYELFFEMISMLIVFSAL